MSTETVWNNKARKYLLSVEKDLAEKNQEGKEYKLNGTFVQLQLDRGR
jgi:hypothetical protein